MAPDDDLATPGACALATILLNQFTQNIWFQQEKG